MMSLSEISKHARALHSQSILIDCHSDILNPILDGKCRLRNRTEVLRPESWDGADLVSVAHRPTPYQLSPYETWFQCTGQYDVPRFREGGVTAQVMAIYVSDVYLPIALERALDMVAVFYQELEENTGSLVQALSSTDILRAKEEGKTACLLSLEGAAPIGSNLNLLDVFYQLGIRMISLTHSRRNALADGTQVGIQVGGLTNLGRQAVLRMNKLGIVIDLAHLGDTCFWEILDLSQDPVVVSHVSILEERPEYRAPYLAKHPTKGISKLQALAAGGGVVCIVFWDQPDVAAVVDEIEAVFEHVGDDHVGLGSDFYGLHRAPRGLEDISLLGSVTDLLLKRGHSDETVLKVLGGNLMRIFQGVLG